MKNSIRLTAIVLIALSSCHLLIAEEGLDPAVLSKIKAATVFMKVQTNSGGMQGSGFFIAKDLIITNAHVLGMKTDHPQPPNVITAVMNSGMAEKEASLIGTLVGADLVADLAFVHVEPIRQGNMPDPLTLASSKDLCETMPVYILGFPFGDMLASGKGDPAITIGMGNVSSLRLDDDGYLSAIQINGNLNPGNSGGPIVDRKGNLAAISVAAITGTQIGFAIPADMLRRNLDGRITSVEYSDVVRKGDNYSMTVTISMLDPQKKIANAIFYYWFGTPGSTRPVDPLGKFPLHGAPGDSPRLDVRMKYDAALRAWKGSMKDVRVSTGKELWGQGACIVAGIEKATAARQMAEVLATAAVEAKPEPPTVIGARNDSRSQQPTAPGALGQPVDPGTPVKAVDAKNSALLHGSDDRDEKGRAFVRVKATTRVVDLNPKKLLQMVAAPSGKELYAVFEQESAIKIYDPADFKEIGEIPVARSPISLWCDESRIVVVCGESKIVSIIDAQQRKVIRSVPVRDDPQLAPLRVVGKAPDGSYMTIWQAPKAAWWDEFLYQIDDSGKAKRIIKGAIDWCMYTNSGQRLWAQSNFRGSPSGVPGWLDMSTGEKINLMDNKLLGHLGFHRSFAHCFMTFDRRNLVLPTESRDGGAYQTVTLLASADLSRIEMEIPASVVAEVPSANMFVSWGLASKESHNPEVFYISRSTGRVLRRISIDKFNPHPACFTHVNVLPETVYVPGHELLLVHDFNNGDGKISVIKCGPLDNDVKNGDPSLIITNDPPANAVVGKTVTYQPAFTKPANAQKVAFKLKRELDGMKIDAATGKLTFTPTVASLGKYDVSIIADVDGTLLPVLTWTIEVGF